MQIRQRLLQRKTDNSTSSICYSMLWKWKALYSVVKLINFQVLAILFNACSQKKRRKKDQIETTGPVFCSFADQCFWICINVGQPGATSSTPGKVLYQCVQPDLFNIRWSKICLKSGTIKTSFSRNCSIRKWQVIREQLLRRLYLIQFCISLMK